MSFANPAWLWILSALAPLVAIYFLKVRPRRLPVSAFFLWEKIYEEKKASSLFQRLRDLLSLLLLALAIAALAFAAAGPRFGNEDKRDLLIVIDVSPSMKAQHGGKESFRMASEKAREIVRALNGTRRAALASASGDLKFLCHLSAAPKDLLDALSAVSVSDVPVSSETVKSLNGLVSREEKGHRVLLLTDGNGGWDGLDSKVEVLRFGGTGSNAGIVAADLAWAESGEGAARFFYRIASTFPAETHAELELRHEDGGGLMRLVPVVLKSGADATGTLDVENAAPGRWIAELKIQDALATDNRVSMGLAPKRPVTVRLATKEGYFFGRSVDAFANTGGVLQRVETGGELTIAEGVPPDDSRLLVFAPQGSSPFWKSAGEGIDVVAVENKAPQHPLVKTVDLDAVRFDGAKKVEPADGSLVLAVSDSGQPLMWKSEVGGRSAVVVNLEPSQGDFFLSPWFPAIVHAAALHLAERADGMMSVYPTGSKVIVDGTLIDPLKAASQGDARIEKAGFHELDQAGALTVFGGALLNRAETLLDGSGPKASAGEVAAGHPLAFWLIALAVVVLAGESLLYHRRKAG